MKKHIILLPLAMFALAACESSTSMVTSLKTGSSMETFRDVQGPFDPVGMGFILRDKKGKVLGTFAHGMKAPILDPLSAAIIGGAVLGAGSLIDAGSKVTIPPITLGR